MHYLPYRNKFPKKHRSPINIITPFYVMIFSGITIVIIGGVTQLEVSKPHGECFLAPALNCNLWYSVPLTE